MRNQEGPMQTPEGTLTPAQFEIMQVIWDADGATGLTVAEIWEGLQKRRALGRTTVLNQVNRLASRKWLRRHNREDGVRFSAALARDDAQAALARTFTEDYFAGSAGSLFQSLLGSAEVSPDELAALRQIVQKADQRKQASEEKP
jgi:BlaI family transcriptional regulator, penicillinase repressor